MAPGDKCILRYGDKRRARREEDDEDEDEDEDDDDYSSPSFVEPVSRLKRPRGEAEEESEKGRAHSLQEPMKR